MIASPTSPARVFMTLAPPAQLTVIEMAGEHPLAAPFDVRRSLPWNE